MSQKMQTIMVAAGVALLFVSSTWGMYCPQTGRFLQREPLGIQVGARWAFSPLRQYAQGLSLCEYVRSGPVKRQDPTGLNEEVAAAARCNPYLGIPEILLPSDWDDRPEYVRRCVLEHEKRHAKQMRSCCRRYRDCLLLETLSDWLPGKCDIEWSGYVNCNRGDWECAAYKVSYRCFARACDDICRSLPKLKNPIACAQHKVACPRAIAERDQQKRQMENFCDGKPKKCACPFDDEGNPSWP